MLNVTFFTFNAFEENTYIIANEQQHCWIVDPGMYHDDEKQALVKYMTDNGLQPQAVINTHTHIDHIFGVQYLMDKYSIPFGCHELERSVLQMAEASGAMFGFDFKKAPSPTFYIQEGPLMLGKDEVDVLFTPGHSTGSISFYYKPGNWVLSGDVLFNGSIGRTDLPGGSMDVLLNSIRTKLFTLPDNTVVLSGHGPATHIGDEKKYNPFLK